jgi:hypothetical protein
VGTGNQYAYWAKFQKDKEEREKEGKEERVRKERESLQRTIAGDALRSIQEDDLASAGKKKKKSRLQGSTLTEARSQRELKAKEDNKRKRNKEGPTSGYGHDPANEPLPIGLSITIYYYIGYPGKPFKQTAPSKLPFFLDPYETFVRLSSWVLNRLLESDIWKGIRRAEYCKLDLEDRSLTVGYLTSRVACSKVPDFPVPFGENRTFEQFLEYIKKIYPGINHQEPKLCFLIPIKKKWPL